MHTGIESPKGVWWQPVHKAERLWVTVAFVWCIILFAMMPFWHVRGGQNPSGIRSKVDPQAFMARTQEFINTYQIDDEGPIPLVAPPPGSDIYLIGMMWQWRPALQLERGAEYVLHISSLDVNHGLSIFPINVNFQIVPGYDYALRVTPTDTGDFRIICNEFCGIGHHLMLGKVVVVEPGTGTPAAAGGDK